MPPTGIRRRLFIVPVARNNSGKSAIVRGMLNHAHRRKQYKKPQQGTHELHTPAGTAIDALVVVRAYQESLAGSYESVNAALSGLDQDWTSRDLIVLPSHCDDGHCQEILEVAHGAGFDAIAARIALSSEDHGRCQNCTGLDWDERWTVRNQETDNWKAQTASLGANLWAWLSDSLTSA